MTRLDGLRVVVTRARHQAGELINALEARGAVAIALPMIAIVPPDDGGPLRQAAVAAAAAHYDWLVFTSANAVEALAEQLPAGWQGPANVAAIGAATREAAERHGFRVLVTPAKYVSEALVKALGGGLKGSRILIPSAAVRRDVVVTALRAQGALVDVVEAYRNVIPPESVEAAAQLFNRPLPDWVTFASPSAVEHLASLVALETLRQIRVASIGPVTSAAIRQLGLKVTAEAAEASTASLVDAITS